MSAFVHSREDFLRFRRGSKVSKSFNHDHHLKELKLYHFFLTPYSGPTTLKFFLGSRAKTKNASVCSQLFYHCSSQTIPYLIEIFSQFILANKCVKCPWSEISDFWYSKFAFDFHFVENWQRFFNMRHFDELWLQMRAVSCPITGAHKVIKAHPLKIPLRKMCQIFCS